MRDSNPQTIHLKDYKPPEYLIENVDLEFDLDSEQTIVTTRLGMVSHPDCTNKSHSLVLMGEQLELLEVKLDDLILETNQYSTDTETLTIQQVPQNQRFTIIIKNRINPSRNTALEGLYLSKDMLCTQCEAEGFRKITYFLDRPDVMARFTTTLRADKTQYPVLLSNGNMVEKGSLDNNRHWVKWEDPFKKPCYLFALVAGRLSCLKDTYVTGSGRSISLQIFVEPDDLDKCNHAMQSLKNSMRWDEQNYGREYDLDLYMIVAVGHFNMGAMENKGLNIFNTKFVLARADTATDADYEHVEGVIAHEYFHNWTGNRITCRDWFQLSLKEGLTVFRDQEFTADQTSRAVKRIGDVNLLRTRQFIEDSGPLAHPIRPDSYIEINNFYTLTVYEKGAEVIRMMHTLLGKEGFRKGMDLYFERHDGQAVTCDDYVQALEDANGVDLSQFRLWYSQAGTPEISVSSQYQPDSETLTITLRQSCPPSPKQPEKKPLHIPVKMGLLAPDGSEIQFKTDKGKPATKETILELTETEQIFELTAVKQPPVMSLLRGFSAPVKLHITRSLEELAFLFRHDPDPFNRWEAGQQLACSIMLGLIKGNTDQVNPLLSAVYRDLLQQPWEDFSYLSQLLSLPPESFLGEMLEVIDTDAIHQTLHRVKLDLAQQLQSELNTHYELNHREESGQFDATAIGRRRLKNTCLNYLGELNTETTQTMASRQFGSAKNMTDQIAALSAIVFTAHPEKLNCLEQFYQQWQDNDLVIDKWFALQACNPLPNTLEKVTELLDHAAFDMNNPNRVRSLIGAFCMNNAVNFHQDNGHGYQFLADKVIMLNSINPQVAARMITPLTTWKRYSEKRQGFMKTELERIIKAPNVSKDIYEVASKSLL